MHVIEGLSSPNQEGCDATLAMQDPGSERPARRRDAIGGCHHATVEA